MSGLVAVRNFAQVSATLSRGAQPVEAFEYAWLAKQGVKTLISLRAEAHRDRQYADKHGMALYEFAVKDGRAPTREQAQAYLLLLRVGDPGFFIHCHHGHGRTSLFSVLARLSSGWSLQRALREEEDRFGYRFVHPAQANFLAEMAATIREGKEATA